MRRWLIAVALLGTAYVVWEALGRFTWDDVNRWRSSLLSDAAPVDLQQGEEGYIEVRRREVDLNEGLDLSELPSFATQAVDVTIGGIGRNIRLERGGQELSEYYEARMESELNDSGSELYRVPEGSMEGGASIGIVDGGR